jgi:hypothetical protein
MLPGWMPGGGISRPIPVISLFGQATSAAATITLPASIAAGDLIVLLDRARNSNLSSPATVVPSGFTSVSDVNDAFAFRQIVSVKLATGSEGGASITGMSGNAQNSKIVAVFRKDTVTTSLNILDVEGFASLSGNPPAQTVNCSASGQPLIVFGCYGVLSGAPTRTFTPAQDAEIVQATTWLRYRAYPAAPVDTTVDMDNPSSLEGLQSFYVELI